MTACSCSNDSQYDARLLTRRDMLSQTGMGFGMLGLSYLLEQEANAFEAGTKAAPRVAGGFDLTPKAPHIAPKAKAFIQLVQTGGPSHMDLFDPKPVLTQRDGEVYEVDVPDFQKGSAANKLLASPFKFQRYGHCGMDLSEVASYYEDVVDDLCWIRSMVGVHNNHTESIVNLATGRMFTGRPSLGAWLSYALGTENDSLPAYVVLRDPAGYATSGMLMVQPGFLPAIYGGTEFQSSGMPVQNLQSAVEFPDGVQKQRLDLIAKLNEAHRERYPADSKLEARIRNYELAARMQSAAAEAIDISTESEATKKLYGLDKPHTASYGRRCLLARRLVEAGVRFVQVFVGKGQPWDQHGSLKSGLQTMCAGDTPSVGLIKDLKDRGLLDSTIVFWAGEFGRQPVAQGDGGNGRDGRDHNKECNSVWLAGGGFKGGLIYGESDDVGYAAAVDRITMPDLFATIAKQMGLNHERVTYPRFGRQESMTDPPVTGAKVHEKLVG